MDIVARAKNIVTTPRTEWPVAAGEAADVASLYTGYILPVAAIGPVALLISVGVFGGLGLGLVVAISSYISNLVGVFIFALIVSKLAPSFGGHDDMVQALKLAAYSHTPAWLAGIFLLIPLLGLLVLLAAIYGIYLFYLGATPTLGVLKEKCSLFTIVSIVVVIVVMVALRYLLYLIFGGAMVM